MSYHVTYDEFKVHQDLHREILAVLSEAKKAILYKDAELSENLALITLLPDSIALLEKIDDLICKLQLDTPRSNV